MTHLKEGDKAPAFTGKDQNGEKISLADYKGKKLVLYFYPQDNTPTCTVQACNLRDNDALLRKEGFSILGISPDDEKSHKKFEAKFDLPFPLQKRTDAFNDHLVIVYDKYLDHVAKFDISIFTEVPLSGAVWISMVPFR